MGMGVEGVGRCVGIRPMKTSYTRRDRQRNIVTENSGGFPDSLRLLLISVGFRFASFLFERRPLLFLEVTLTDGKTCDNAVNDQK